MGDKKPVDEMTFRELLEELEENNFKDPIGHDLKMNALFIRLKEKADFIERTGLRD